MVTRFTEHPTTDRYNDDPDVRWEVDPDGRWVRYSDYESLMQRYEELRIKLSWIENPDRMGK